MYEILIERLAGRRLRNPNNGAIYNIMSTNLETEASFIDYTCVCVNSRSWTDGWISVVIFHEEEGYTLIIT